MTTNGHCRIDTAGTYTLTATSGTLDAATSGSFTIFGTAAKLAFTTSSSGSTGGIAFPTQPMVTVQDAGGNTVTTSTVSVTLSIPAGTPVLTCSRNPMNAVAGVATFAGCRINNAGTYTLTATSGVLTAAVSNTVTIS